MHFDIMNVYQWGDISKYLFRMDEQMEHFPVVQQLRHSFGFHFVRMLNLALNKAHNEIKS